MGGEIWEEPEDKSLNLRSMKVSSFIKNDHYYSVNIKTNLNREHSFLSVTVYDDDVVINYRTEYKFVISGESKKKLLRELDYSYKEYKEMLNKPTPSDSADNTIIPEREEVSVTSPEMVNI